MLVNRREKREAEYAALKAEQKLQSQRRKELRAEEKQEGLEAKVQNSAINSKSEYKTVEEESKAAEDAVIAYLKNMQSLFPGLLKRLSRVSDFREPGKVSHRVDVILLLGILTFAFQKLSRRQATREMTTATFLENLRILIPELESLPHHDTINRFLTGVDIKELEGIYFGLFNKFIRSKKFKRYLLNGQYCIAIDGTQKYTYNFLWAPECQRREIEGKMQYYCYCLEAFLVLPNGMSIPLATEMLSYLEGDINSDKQDSELKAFTRLSLKIKKAFPKLRIMVVLDGLYPNGKVMELCNKYKWDYMIVLPDKCLKSVWQEYGALKDIEKNNRAKLNYGNRKQEFIWVNDIYYEYGVDKSQLVNVVVCHEEWDKIGEGGAKVKMHSKHVWISKVTINRINVHSRCNLCARRRWGIESGILVEKKYGYQYEHTFSFDWNAAKAYHLLMHIAHMINTLAQHGSLMKELFLKKGLQATIKYIDETFRKILLDVRRVREILSQRYQVRFS